MKIASQFFVVSVIVSGLVSPLRSFAETGSRKSEATQTEQSRCGDSAFLGNAAAEFTCEVDLSIDACDGLGLDASIAARRFAAGFAGGLAAEALRAKFSDAAANRRFNQYLELRESYSQSTLQARTHGHEASRLDQRWSGALGFSYQHRFSGEYAYDRRRAEFERLDRLNSPAWREAQSAYHKHKAQQIVLEKQASEQRKALEAKAKRWGLDAQSKGTPATLGEALKKLDTLDRDLRWAKFEEFDRRTFGKNFPEHATYAAERQAIEQKKIASLKTSFEAARAEARTAYRQAHSARFRASGKAVRSGVMSSAAAGAALVLLPEAINFVGSQTCNNIRGQERVRDYLKITPGRDNCQVSLLDQKEIEIYTMTGSERAELFDRFPILCQAWLKKVDARRERLVSAETKTEITHCSPDGAKANIEIRGRKYDYDFKFSGGGITVKSPFGSGGEAHDPVMLEYKYNPRTKSFSQWDMSPKQLQMLLSSEERDLKHLNAFYAIYSEQMKPTPRIERTSVSGHMAMLPKHVSLTVAEQMWAMKQALPQIMQACAAVNEVAGTEQGGVNFGKPRVD